MYLRQHPTYRRLSTQLGRSRPNNHATTSIAVDDQPDGDDDDDDAYDALGPESPSRDGPTAHDFTGWERIGRGGFGKVYRVEPRHPHMYNDERQVAIKMVDKRALKDTAAEIRLASEVAIHESMAHKSIVSVHDSFEDDRFVYLVMEYCKGGDLWRYLRQRYLLLQQDGRNQDKAGALAMLSENEARGVMEQVCDAVVYVHSCGAMHRDLKLANIMLSSEMVAKVGDFGLATWIRGDRTTEPTTLCGTPSYISPEILARQPYGFESDIWALGCLLVTLLTGAQPFGSSAAEGNNRKKITEELVAQIRLPRDISMETKQLVRSMLRIDPRKRIRSQDLLNHPFFAPRMARNRLLTLDEVKAQAKQNRLHARRVLLPPPQPANRHLQQPEPVANNVSGTAAGLFETEADHPRSTYNHHRHHQPRDNSNPGAFSQTHVTTTSHNAEAVSLSRFTTQRLQPLKRALKNGKVYLRSDHLFVIDLTTSPTLIAMDEQRQAIYEFKRPLHLDALQPNTAARTYQWNLQVLPDRVSRVVRVGCRCVMYLLAQQKRLKINTPQGRAWLFDDQPKASFRIAFFNGIRVDIQRKRSEVTVEIPSSQDLPPEIHKIPLMPGDFADPPDFDHERQISNSTTALDARVPNKIRGIMRHAQETLRRMLAFDAVLREFEPQGALFPEYRGKVEYPVEMQWEWGEAVEIDYVPPGLVRNRQPSAVPVPRAQETRQQTGVSNTVGSTTVAATTTLGDNQPGLLPRRRPGQNNIDQRRNPPDQRHHRPLSTQTQQTPWGTHLLDRRTVDDTPTRRLNLGPITRLVEEFNQSAHPSPQQQQPLVLHTPANPASVGRPLTLPVKQSLARVAHEIAARNFQEACFVPQVGWCMAAQGAMGDDDDYVITILFCDGCRLLINVRDQVASYIDATSEYSNLPFDHSIPVRVKER
ncbi:hypothetical protein H4R99_004277, partial [Coemansia sp. RSA 1722]